MKNEPSHPRTNEGDRRNALTAIGALITGFLGAIIPAGAGVVTVLDSLRQRPKPRAFQDANSGDGNHGDGDYVRIAHVDAVPSDGQPRRFTVRMDQVDAWNFTADYPVGAVYVRRTGNAEGKVQVFHSTCPHAGCSVAPSVDGQAFHCPCHNSAFDLDGKRIIKAGKENPSPRDLDELDCDPQKLAQGEIWVRFQNFETGEEVKKPKL